MLYSVAVFPTLCLAFTALLAKISRYSLAFAVALSAADFCGDNMQCKWKPYSATAMATFIKRKAAPRTRINNNMTAKTLRR